MKGIKSKLILVFILFIIPICDIDVINIALLNVAIYNILLLDKVIYSRIIIGILYFTIYQIISMHQYIIYPLSFFISHIIVLSMKFYKNPFMNFKWSQFALNAFFFILISEILNGILINRFDLNKILFLTIIYSMIYIK